MKIIDRIEAAWSQDQVAYSFEFMPPKTAKGMKLLLESLDRVVVHQPTFCDITWRSNSSELSLEIAAKMQKLFNLETMMHLTCVGSSVASIDNALDNVKENGVRNILALRGDPPEDNTPTTTSDEEFSCALDLVTHIRKQYKDHFGIVVAGYPEAHPDVISSDGVATAASYQSDLEYLKTKVQAGADFIITQLFYDTEIFFKFVDDCRNIGITCPIVPGILPISDHRRFLRMTGLCKTKVPTEIKNTLDSIKDNNEAVRAYGIHLGTEMCKNILARGIKALHLYTLNNEKTPLEILKNLGLVDVSNVKRPLSISSNGKCNHEDEGYNKAACCTELGVSKC